MNCRTYAVGVSREVWRDAVPPRILFFLGHCGGFAAVTEKRESWGGEAYPNPSTT
jgi:hypothetical protein